jgi:hypothetical protein
MKIRLILERHHGGRLASVVPAALFAVPVLAVAPGARSNDSTLRGFAARAPYFHNDIAATLEDVVRHYETHLGFIFTDQERADLVAFLNAL